MQALSVTGQVSYGAAIPIIMGQNIGTCITALLSSFGTNKNAKRAAIVHLSFNVIGTIVWLVVFSIISAIFKPALLDMPAGYLGIAIAHSIFNVACTALLLPMSSLLEKLAIKLVPDSKENDGFAELDERLLATPPIAVEMCKGLVSEMGALAVDGFKKALALINDYDKKRADEIREAEERADHLEDVLGTYLVKLSRSQISDADSSEVSKLLKLIGDFERISDHSVDLLESVEELRDKEMCFTDDARKELSVLCGALDEILTITHKAYLDDDYDFAREVEPLEQVIDGLKESLRSGHINRLKEGNCTIEAGFVWADLLTNLERTADHCSNIAACVIDSAHNSMNLHESVRMFKRDHEFFDEKFAHYAKKYSI